MPDEKHYLIVGLGNPGKQYALTRHNMGYLVVQGLAEALNWKFKQEKQFSAEISKGKLGEITLHLMLPLTYMNLSGQAVRRYLDFYKLSSDALIVVADEIALPFGQLRLKPSGSAGGHNGLKSIEAHLNTQNYVRLRVGIGEKQQPSLADHVLDSFNSEEKAELPKILEQAMEALLRLMKEGITTAMNKANVKTSLAKKKEE